MKALTPKFPYMLHGGDYNPDQWLDRPDILDRDVQLMQEAHEIGAPVMRPLYYDFPQDKTAAEVEDCYMFGPDMLVAPILEAGADTRRVYLPANHTWMDAYTKQVYEGGQFVTVPAPIGVIPVLLRDGKDYPIYE